MGVTAVGVQVLLGPFHAETTAGFDLSTFEVVSTDVFELAASAAATPIGPCASTLTISSGTNQPKAAFEVVTGELGMSVMCVGVNP